MTLLAFDPFHRFERPSAILHCPGKLTTDKRHFTIDYLVPHSEGGGSIAIWSGTDYGAALTELAELQRQGLVVHETVGGAI